MGRLAEGGSAKVTSACVHACPQPFDFSKLYHILASELGCCRPPTFAVSHVKVWD